MRAHPYLEVHKRFAHLTLAQKNKRNLMKNCLFRSLAHLHLITKALKTRDQFFLLTFFRGSLVNTSDTLSEVARVTVEPADK